MEQKINNCLKCILILLYVVISIISINHIYGVWDIFRCSTLFLGVLGWIVTVFSIYYFSRLYVKKALFLFFMFFCLGYFSGPFLEPPADPIDHLDNSYAFIGQSSKEIRKNNGGFWTYSMNHLLLLPSQKTTNPDSVLRRINILNGVYYGILIVGLFILMKSSNLPDHWSFIGCLLAVAFFGTNRFSYFSYYSLSPSALSMLIYWLWISNFFFERKPKTILTGSLVALILIPIILVNHIQEAIFLGFITTVWVFINLSEYLFIKRGVSSFENRSYSVEHAKIKSKQGIFSKNWHKFSYIIMLIAMLWILPQFNLFQETISKLFVINDWKKNQELVYSLNGWHLLGNIWDPRFRVSDTLGIVGFLPVILGIYFILSGTVSNGYDNRIRIFILGILPLLVYCIPLFNFIWVSNCRWTSTHIRYYYRFCYSSLFFVTIAFFLYGMSDNISSLINKLICYFKKQSTFNTRNYYKNEYFIACFIIILLIGCFRSPPVYGKLDFMSLNSKPWWEDWRQMIHEVNEDKTKPVLSDRATLKVLNGIFNIPVSEKFENKVQKGNINIHSFANLADDKFHKFIVNLQGFKPSWVPDETHHWAYDYADPFANYRYKNKFDEDLIDVLHKIDNKNFAVYY